MKSFVIAEPVFRTETLFVVGCSFDAFKAYLKRRSGRDAGDYVGQCGQMFTFDDKCAAEKNGPCPVFRCVWSVRREFPIVLHEIFHLVTRICQDKGIPIKAYTELGCEDEPAAYLFEFFAREVLKHMR